MKRFLYLLLIFLIIQSCGELPNCGEIPHGNKNSLIRIIKIIPNPRGDDLLNENFIIKNFDSSPESLDGWKLTNSKGLIWELGVVQELGPCSTKTIMSVHSDGFNNVGDTIRLTDGDNMLIQEIIWIKANDGENIYPQ